MVYVPPIREKVEYDGYYLIDVLTTTGFKFTVPVRGHKLKSWLNFEKSLTTHKECKHRQVTEEEYMKYHWSSHDISDPVKKPKKTVTKPPPKTAVVKKAPAKKVAPKKKSLPAPKTVAVKTVAVVKKAPAKKTTPKKAPVKTKK